MNVLQIVSQWFVDEIIDEAELRECLQNLNVTKHSIDRFVKDAEFERVKARAEKERARTKSQNAEEITQPKPDKDD